MFVAGSTVIFAAANVAPLSASRYTATTSPGLNVTFVNE